MNTLTHTLCKAATRLLVIVVGAALCIPTAGGAELSKEYSVKLAFLYKFANYVENSRIGNRDHITIGIYGEDPFGSTLDAVAAQRKARGKSLRIARFTRMEDYRTCDILFVSGAISSAQLQQLLQLTQNDGVLIVGEQPQFTSKGGIMNFHIDASGRTAIQLNVDAARARDLRIDARLMRVCDIVDSRSAAP